MVREFLRSIFGNRQSSSTAHDMAIRQHYVASHKPCTVIAHQLLLYITRNNLLFVEQFEARFSTDSILFLYL